MWTSVLNLNCRHTSPAFPRWVAWPQFRMRTLRSEEHTSELQSHLNLVCRLLLEKKKKDRKQPPPHTPRRQLHPCPCPGLLRRPAGPAETTVMMAPVGTLSWHNCCQPRLVAIEAH